MDVNLPADVVEEIADLCRYVPEVENHFAIIDKIGEGTFSSVFLARLKHQPDVQDLFALKHIVPTSHPSRVLSELKCLQIIGGKQNVIGVELCLRSKDHIVFVMRYFPHQKFQDYFHAFDVHDVREYMRNLLVALRNVHSRDIVHRDIKPSNFLHNAQTKQLSVTPLPAGFIAVLCRSLCNAGYEPWYMLVDFGLAHDAPAKLCHQNAADIAMMDFESGCGRQSVSKKRSHSSLCCGNFAMCSCYASPSVCTICSRRSVESARRAGTPGFRSPEVLMKHPIQTTAVDMWSAGVIFLSLLSARYPFFRTNSDMVCLGQIISVLGLEKVRLAASTYGKMVTCYPVTKPLALKMLCTELRTSSHVSRKASAVKPTKQWSEIPDQAIDLLSQLLDPNPTTRISAKQSLQHPFFSDS